jgi:hypothetical protein
MTDLRVASLLDEPKAVPDDEILYRRIPPLFLNWSQASNGVPLIPSQGFQDVPDEMARTEYGLPKACMSVDVHSILTEAGSKPIDLLIGLDNYGLARFQAGDARNLKTQSGEDWSQGIMLDPLPDKPTHAVVFSLSGIKKSKGAQKALARAAEWEIAPVRLRSAG